MNEPEHGLKTHGGPHRDHGHRPYWKRAHRVGRFYAAVFLMLVAMITYAMTDHFTWQPRSQQPALELWQGAEANALAAQHALDHRARCNQAPRRGEDNAAKDVHYASDPK